MNSMRWVLPVALLLLAMRARPSSTSCWCRWAALFYMYLVHVCSMQVDVLFLHATLLPGAATALHIHHQQHSLYQQQDLQHSFANNSCLRSLRLASHHAVSLQMDGFEDNRGLVVLGATNRPGAIDAALIRPGRFDRIIYMPLPDAKGRAEILQVQRCYFG
jgi:hypothetical protein